MSAQSEIQELHDRAISCITSNNMEEAIKLFSELCDIDRKNVKAWMMLGGLYAQTADPVRAEHCYRQVIKYDEGNADAINRLAGILLTQHRYDDAEKSCRRALQINSGNAEIHANLGNILSAQGRLDEAATSFMQALQLEPDFLGAYMNLANVQKVQGQYDQAAVNYRKILEINPRYVDIYNALGECYLESGMLDKSLQCYQDALRIRPDYIQAYMNKAFILGEMGNYAEAMECYVRVLEIEPQHVDAFLNRGLVEKRQGHYDEAAGSYRKALELQPDNPDTRLSLSLVELSRGNFAEGWRFYAARKSVRNHDFDKPGLLNKDLSGTRILVIKDQGIGDEIFFLRFVRQLKERGAWLAYQTDPKIKSLVEHLPFIDEVISGNEPSPDCDLRLSAGDLPLSLGFDNNTPIPSPVELPVLSSRMAEVRSLLSEIGPGPYIGITWWAGTKRSVRYLDDKLAYREIPVDLLVEALRPVESTVLALQRNPDETELRRFSSLLGRTVHDLSRFNDDIEGMLALLSLLDDYVGVDNSNMHLSTGIGRSCRILVPHPPEWRMMTAGVQSPWFPGFSLYRQNTDGDWSEAINQLGADLVSSFA